MRTVNHYSKRILALLLICVLCINLFLGTGSLQRAAAAEVSASGVDLMDSATFEGKEGVLSYDVNKKEGWIGGDGTTPSTDQPAGYFSYNTYGNVMVGGSAVPLTDCEVTYSVTFSDFAYDTATYPSGVRSQGVLLMLQYNDGTNNWLLENRFGGQMYASGHYMQIGGSGSTLLANNAGAPFYSESVKNSVANFPALANGDTLSLKVKCANGAEKGYIKLLLNGEEMHTFIYTGTKLPEFGLKSYKLMAKMTNISLTVEGATGWSQCVSHIESEKIVDVQPSSGAEGKWHTECTICGETMNTGTIPMLTGMDLLASGASLPNQNPSALSYDFSKKEGWIGGNGTVTSTEDPESYFQFATYKDVLVDGKPIALNDCEVTYSVTFSDITYDPANPNGVRGQGVVLLLRYNNWTLENRFGGIMYASGHYMQIGGSGSTLLEANAGAPFYSESVKNSVANFPALANGDTISLAVKCANGAENGYIKLLINGVEKHRFVYTGTKLPEFGLKARKLMTKISNISVMVAGAQSWAGCSCEKPAVDNYVGKQSCTNGGTVSGLCTNCGNVHTKQLPPSGHAPSDWIVDKEATSQFEGLQHKECTVCGEHLGSEPIPALGGLELIDKDANFYVTEGTNASDKLSYNIKTQTGWLGGNGTTPSLSTADRYFTFPTYMNVLVDGQQVPFTDCELVYSMVFSDFSYDSSQNCRSNAVCLMLRYTDGENVYKLENRFGGQIYDSGHYMQVYANNVGVGNVLQDTGAPFYSTVKNSFPNVPALKDGDKVELKIKCANGTENGYIKLYLNGAEIGAFVYTGTSFPEFGLESMKLMAKVSNVSLMVTGATQWAECNCATPNVKKYETTIQSTCTTDGLKSGKCVTCDNLHSVVIPASHTEGKDWIVDQEATCTQEGSRYKECMICFEHTQEETIPAAGHRSYWVEDKAATKLIAGSKHEECMICQEVLNTETIPSEWNPVLIIGGGVILLAGLAVGVFFLVKSRRKK